MAPLIFYTTDNCSLCERAFDWLLQRGMPLGRVLQTVDVAGDDRLMARYGERLPVFVADTRELAWPFDADMLDAFLFQLD